MSARIKLFIYTDTQSQTVVFTKKSAEFDFFITLKDIAVQAITSSGQLPEIRTFSRKSNEKVSKKAQERLALLRHKVELAVLVLTSLQVMRAEIKASFSYKVIESAPINDENFKTYWRFMAEEKKILESKIGKFQKKFFKDMDAVKSISEATTLYEHIRFNLNLGVYSVMNRERKGLDGTKG